MHCNQRILLWKRNQYTSLQFKCPNARLSNFVVWFSIWSSLIVITDEGRNPETGWLRSYLVSLQLLDSFAARTAYRESFQVFFTALDVGVWSVWSSWGACSNTCNAGWQKRFRRCVDSANKTRFRTDCPHTQLGNTEFRNCPEMFCTINGNKS